MSKERQQQVVCYRAGHELGGELKICSWPTSFAGCVVCKFPGNACWGWRLGPTGDGGLGNRWLQQVFCYKAGDETRGLVLDELRGRGRTSVPAGLAGGA